LEVEDPGSGKSTLVSVKDRSGGTIAQLIVGKRRYDRLGAGNDGVYVRRPGDAQAWLARGTLDPSGEASGWLDPRILDIPASRLAKVSLSQADGTKLVISRSAPEAKFTVGDAPPAPKFNTQTT